MRMTRKALNLLVDEELVKKAREQGLIISKFLENKLQEYFTFIDAVSKQQNTSKWTGWDLNPRPLPCEGNDLPLIYQPNFFKKFVYNFN